MKQFKGVIGTMETVPTLEVNVTTVYVRSNIKQVEIEGLDRKAWQYDEIQYDIKEYQEDVGIKTEALAADTDAVAELIASTMEDNVTATELLSVIVEDTANVTEMLASLVEQNALLSARIAQLEGGEKVNG